MEDDAPQRRHHRLAIHVSCLLRLSCEALDESAQESLASEGAFSEMQSRRLSFEVFSSRIHE